VAFASDASNLVPPDTNDKRDIFVRLLMAQSDIDLGNEFKQVRRATADVLWTCRQTKERTQELVAIWAAKASAR
jgi:hypothetical protein